MTNRFAFEVVMVAIFLVAGYRILPALAGWFFVTFAGCFYFFSVVAVASRSRGGVAWNLTDAERARTQRILQRLTKNTGFAMPKIYLAGSILPTATMYDGPNNSAIVISLTLLNILSDEELEGIFAHELGHIRNRDAPMKRLAFVAVFGIASYLLNITGILSVISRCASTAPAYDILWCPIALLATFMVLVWALSLPLLRVWRDREYAADKVGVELSGNPMAMCTALQKTRDWELERSQGAKHREPASPGFIGAAFRIHPPVQERIVRLKQLAVNRRVAADGRD